MAQPLAPGEGYLRIVDQFGGSLALAFELLSNDDALPAVFHCTAGRDRTGIVAALLLDLLGVPDDVIAADYVLTERASERTTAWIEAHEPAFAAYMAQFPPERRVVRPETILGFLDGVRSTYGSVPEFLAALGHPGGPGRRPPRPTARVGTPTRRSFRRRCRAHALTRACASAQSRA